MALNLNAIKTTIISQPKGDEKLKPKSGEWNVELLKTCDPVTDGILYCLCAGACEGILHTRAGEHFCSCAIPGSLQTLRTSIRIRYGIKGSVFEDCWTSCFCCPCVLLQLKKELDQHNVPDPTSTN